MIDTSYKYYKEIYKGALSEEDFDRVSHMAGAYIEKITFGRTNQAKDSDNVDLAFCAVCDVFADLERRRKAGGQKVSENNDGYSVSFLREGMEGQTLEGLYNHKAYQAAAVYLQPTGLLDFGCDNYDD